MFFASDNSSAVHPNVLKALARANAGYSLGYGNDDTTQKATALIRDFFEAPEAEVFFVASGTAANALCLSALAQPTDAVFCTAPAHINVDECNAPEFYTGGAKLVPVADAHGKMQPEALGQEIAIAKSRGVHGARPAALALSQATECGTVYQAEEIAALCEIAKSAGLRTHLDGARLSNALVATGASPAEMTWRAGIDAVSFGGTKNGLMAAEACVFFNPEDAELFAYRRKRAGHLLSKHRYLSAQFLAFLEADLWKTMASDANAAMAQLAKGAAPYLRFQHTPEANMLFAELPTNVHEALQAAGAFYYAEEITKTGVVARFVTSWSTTSEDITAFHATLQEAAQPR